METSNSVAYEDIKAYDSPTNGSIFLKTYPDSHLANIAYDDGICYIYVDLGGSRTRFTSDWWNASYKVENQPNTKEAEEEIAWTVPYSEIMKLNAQVDKKLKQNAFEQERI